MRKYKNLKNLLLVMQIGTSVALPIAAGAYIGSYLDKRYSTTGVFLILGILLGTFSGITSIYYLVSKLNK